MLHCNVLCYFAWYSKNLGESSTKSFSQKPCIMQFTRYLLLVSPGFASVFFRLSTYRVDNLIAPLIIHLTFHKNYVSTLLCTIILHIFRFINFCARLTCAPLANIEFFYFWLIDLSINNHSAISTIFILSYWYSSCLILAMRILG